MHPDRGGNAVQFDRIARAYQTLTNPKLKANWEAYGNPDGRIKGKSQSLKIIHFMTTVGFTLFENFLFFD